MAQGAALWPGLAVSLFVRWISASRPSAFPRLFWVSHNVGVAHSAGEPEGIVAENQTHRQPFGRPRRGAGPRGRSGTRSGRSPIPWQAREGRRGLAMPPVDTLGNVRVKHVQNIISRPRPHSVHNREAWYGECYRNCCIYYIDSCHTRDTCTASVHMIRHRAHQEPWSLSSIRYTVMDRL